MLGLTQERDSVRGGYTQKLHRSWEAGGSRVQPRTKHGRCSGSRVPGYLLSITKETKTPPMIWQLLQGRTLYPYEAGTGSLPMTPKGIYRKRPSNTSVARTYNPPGFLKKAMKKGGGKLLKGERQLDGD